MKILVFCDVMLWGFLTLKINAVPSLETSGTVASTTRLNTPYLLVGIN